MSKLFTASDSESETDIKIHNFYAKTYDNWRQKEELNKLKTKYGEEVLNESNNSTSSSDDEDEEGLQITEVVERDFFKTLASLKTKDPKIYDENIEFFGETEDLPPRKSKVKDGPMYIKDYERKLLLETEGHIVDLDNEAPTSRSLTYVEEQTKLKENLKDALQNSDDNGDSNEWGGMFKSRKKTDVEEKLEEENYRHWLLGHKAEVNEEIKNDLKPLKDFWSDPKLNENEKFLRDYILNKRFMEPENKEYIPTYEEIIHDSDEGLSEDEKQVEMQEEFEHKYNYRFEEPDEEFIKRYPRTIECSLRRKDDRRKTKRAEVKERKQKEKQEKMEEIKQMQLLKKTEIEEKIQKLKEITGNTEIAFDDKDIEEDFDPEAHDKRMQHLFNNEFYQGQEEEQKPEFPDLDEELGIENWEQYESQEDNEETTSDQPHCEDENFNMDCDYSPSVQKAPKEKCKKKRKRKTKFAEIISEPKPTFDPDNKTYQEYLDEYYKLECEDVIADIPCRFKYRKVVPNSFGLTIEEILIANDRELNKWCSLKKAVQYRPENIEKYDVIAFGRKGQNESLKKKILPSLFAEENANLPTGAANQVPLENKNSELNKTIQKSKKSRKTKLETNEDSIERENSTQPRDKTTVVSKKKEVKDSSISLSNTNSSENKEWEIENNSTPNKVTVNVVKNNKKTKKKKKKTQKPDLRTEMHTNPNNENNTIPNIGRGKKQNDVQVHKKRKRKDGNKDDSEHQINNKFAKNKQAKELDISDARLKAFGIKPKKFKNKMKYGQKKNTNQ